MDTYRDPYEDLTIRTISWFLYGTPKREIDVWHLFYKNDHEHLTRLSRKQFGRSYIK